MHEDALEIDGKYLHPLELDARRSYDGRTRREGAHGVLDKDADRALGPLDLDDARNRRQPAIAEILTEAPELDDLSHPEDLEQLGERPAGDHASLVHDGDPVTQALGFLH